MDSNIDASGAIDPCIQVLRTTLYTDDDLSRRDKRHLRNALQWYRGDKEHSGELSLIDCLAITRLAGDEFVIQLDYGDEYQYLDFDSRNERIVVRDPDTGDGEDVGSPVEDTELHTRFDDAAITFTTRGDTDAKQICAITIITHLEYGPKIVFGRHPEDFTHVTRFGEEISYETKAIFRLPEPMLPHEVTDWVTSEAGETVRQVIETNSEQDWGDKAQGDK